MTVKDKKYCFIFAAGGTGGHLYPALAVAGYIKEKYPEAEIIFFGRKDKIEGRVVPEKGFRFIHIPIRGLQRKMDLRNFLMPFGLIYSFIKALFVIIRLKPDAVTGAGAYISLPVVWAASVMGSKTVLMEQNSYPGMANRLLEKKAERIFVNFEESVKYFRDSEKVVVSGNPVRSEIELKDQREAKKKFGLDPAKKAILIFGGSLGALKINQIVYEIFIKLNDKDIQIIWQTGNKYFEKYQELQNESLYIAPYIDDMASAYSACDLLVARAGATTISETCFLKIPVIFVPSENVTDNHQFKNVRALEEAGAAILLKDGELEDKLFSTITESIFDDGKLNKLKENIGKFARPDAAAKIGDYLTADRSIMHRVRN